jgi:hypothetical protein
MLTLAIQFISTRALLRADHAADTEWQTHDPQRGVDYTSYTSVADAVTSLELDADGAYQYRIVEVASVEDSYLELRAENEDALEALAAWVAAGCPRGGNALQAVERAALACVSAAPVKIVRENVRAA